MSKEFKIEEFNAEMVFDEGTLCTSIYSNCGSCFESNGFHYIFSYESTKELYKIMKEYYGDD